MGRPFRIHLDDCDVKDLAVEDLLTMSDEITTLSAEAAQVLQKCDQYAPISLALLKLSTLLGDVLSMGYRPRKHGPFLSSQTWSSAEKIDADLGSWQTELSPICRLDGASDLLLVDYGAMTLHKHLLQIFYHITVIALYKPFVFQEDTMPTNPDAHPSSQIAWDRCERAASTAAACYRKIIELDLSSYLPAEGIASLTSIIAILFMAKSLSQDMKQYLAAQNLDLAMMVLEQQREKYLSARFVHAYYTAAFAKVAESPKPPDASVRTALAAGDQDEVLRRDQTQPAQSNTEQQNNDFGYLPPDQEDLAFWQDGFQMEGFADFDILFGEEGIMNSSYMNGFT
jgi:hypothetical protein